MTLPLPLEYIVTLGNGSGTDFQAPPCHHRSALAADTVLSVGRPLNWKDVIEGG